MEYTIRPVNVPFSYIRVWRQISRITLGLRLHITSGTKQLNIWIVSNIKTLISRSQISRKFIFENYLFISLTSLFFSPGLPVLLVFL